MDEAGPQPSTSHHPPLGQQLPPGHLDQQARTDFLKCSTRAPKRQGWRHGGMAGLDGWRDGWDGCMAPLPGFFGPAPHPERTQLAWQPASKLSIEPLLHQRPATGTLAIGAILPPVALASYSASPNPRTAGMYVVALWWLARYMPAYYVVPTIYGTAPVASPAVPQFCRGPRSELLRVLNIAAAGASSPDPSFSF